MGVDWMEQPPLIQDAFFRFVINEISEELKTGKDLVAKLKKYHEKDFKKN